MSNANEYLKDLNDHDERREEYFESLDPRNFAPKEEKQCPRCKGTGLDRYEEEDCDNCNGAGTLCVAHSNPSTDCRRC